MPSTENATTSATTVTSAVTSSSPPVTSLAPDCPRRFDAGSFFGGIVLGAGVLVIIYVIYRLYASRQRDTPYHQF